MKSSEKTRRPNVELMAGVLFLLLAILLTWLLLVSPRHRNLGLFFRYKIYVLPVVMLAAFFAVRTTNQLLKSILYALLFGIFLLPLSGFWNSGSSSQYIFSGTIPWSDAFLHHLNTMRFLFGGTMDQASAVRPLPLIFNALVLWLSENNYFLLYALLTVLSALGVLLNLNWIGKQIGSVAAAFFAANAFFFIRAYIGSYMTESYGFFVGMLSCYFLLRGIFEQRPLLVILGFLSLSLALNIRPGPMFVLGTGGLWFFFIFMKKKSKQFLWSAIALGAMLIGFGLSSFNTFFVNEKGKKLSNYPAAYYIYGLCHGGRDTYFSMQDVKLAQYIGSDHLWTGLYDMCREELTEHPENITISLKVIWNAILFDNERGAFSYFDGGREWIISALRWGLMVVWSIGMIILFRRRRSAFESFLLAMVLGIFLFQFLAPLYNYYRMRYDASVIWVHGLVCGVALQALWQKIIPEKKNAGSDLPNKQDSFELIFANAGLSIVILIAVFAAPLIKKNPIPIPAPPALTCGADEDLIYTRVDPGNVVYLKNYELKQPHAPEFHLLYVRPRIHDTSSGEIFDLVDSFEVPMVIGKGLNLQSFEDIMFFAEASAMEERNGYVSMCGKVFDPPLLHDYNFMTVSKTQFLAP